MKVFYILIVIMEDQIIGWKSEIEKLIYEDVINFYKRIILLIMQFNFNW